MNDETSSDQLDEMPAGVGGDDIADESAIGQDDDEGQEGGGSAKDYKALSAVMKVFAEQAASVLSTVLNKRVSLDVGRCEAAGEEPVKEAVASDGLTVQVPLSGGLEGALQILVTKQDTAVLSDLMMMGNGDAEYTDDHKDAIGELMNQVAGSFCSALGEDGGGSVSTGTVTVEEFDPSSPPTPWENADMVAMKLSVEGRDDSSFAVLIPSALSSGMMERGAGSALRGGGGEDGEEAGEDGGVGLSEEELSDLAGLAGDDGGGGFDETSPAGGTTDTSMKGPAPSENVNMLLDVDLDLAIELGRTNLSIKRVLELAPGSIVELDRLAGEPVDLLVNNRPVAKGEVVVVDENFGIRIVSLVSPEERIRSLRQ